MSTTPDLAAAIREFYDYALLHYWDTGEGAFNECNNASDDFLHCLERFGITGAEIEHFEGTVALDRHDYPWSLSTDCWHWAVRIGDTVVDWTARQFDETAPFPAIWIAKRRTWRNC